MMKFKSCYNKCIKKFFGYSKYYGVTEMLLALCLSSFDTVIHNYRKSFLYVWSKHSNDLHSYDFYCVLLYFFYLLCLPVYLSVCMSVCICVWAMLPDSNKMMMMINRLITPPRIEERGILWRACLSVCLCVRSSLRNYVSDFHQIFCACCLWLWLGLTLTA